MQRAGTSYIRYGRAFCFLSGVRTSGLLPRGVKKEVRSSWSKNLHDKPANGVQITSISLSLRSFWRSRVSLILSARHWASGIGSGREPGITSVSGNTVCKNQSCAGVKIIYCTYISRIHHCASTCCIHACLGAGTSALGEILSSAALNVNYK